MKLLSSLFVCMVSCSLAFGQKLEDLGKDLLRQQVNKGLSDQATKNERAKIDDLLNDVNQQLNQGLAIDRLPKGATVSIEIDSNQTDVPTEQLIGLTKASLRNWWDGLMPSANFADRNEVGDRNRRDRENEEIRNPIPKGQMTRSEYDAHVTAVQRYGYSNTSAGGDIFSRTFFRILGASADYSSFSQVKFIQLTVELRKADTQESPVIIQVVGCDLQGRGVNVNLQTRGFSGGFQQNSFNDLTSRAIADALNRAKGIAEGKRKSKRS